MWVSRRGSKDLNSYFLGGKALPWYLLGVSNASGMFDISGTMWLVYVLFVYGLKSIWLPWVWPTFNQIFLMMFMSTWLRRSNVLTGAEWIQTRFGRDRGANLAHLSVVLFALVNVVGMLAYAFKGIGKFAVKMLPWHFTSNQGLFSNENIYAIIILLVTSFYVIKGGMVSVVITEVMQFIILTVTSVAIGIIAIHEVSPGMQPTALPGSNSLCCKILSQLESQVKVKSTQRNRAASGLSGHARAVAATKIAGVKRSASVPSINRGTVAGGLTGSDRQRAATKISKN
ncbi:MAG: sodium:solute symporter family transporter [Limisphaerales bacterium]